MSRYAGYHIHVRFIGSNLLASDGEIDLEASCRNYAHMIREALEQEFSGARIDVDYVVCGSGSLETRIEGPVASDLAKIAERVEGVAHDVRHAWIWPVYVGN